MLSRFLD